MGRHHHITATRSVNATGMMQAAMRPRFLQAPAAALALGFALAGCDTVLRPGDADLHLIREVSAGDGMRLLADPETVLVQVLEPKRTAGRVAGTQIVSARDPIPSHIAETSATVVILAEDAREGLRVAARLVRIGIQDVAIVRGGVAAWEAARRAGTNEENAERT